MKVKLFMENMWEFFLVFYFVPYKVNIPMHAGEFFYVYFLFHVKLIFPCMQVCRWFRFAQLAKGKKFRL